MPNRTLTEAEFNELEALITITKEEAYTKGEDGQYFFNDTLVPGVGHQNVEKLEKTASVRKTERDNAIKQLGELTNLKTEVEALGVPLDQAKTMVEEYHGLKAASNETNKEAFDKAVDEKIKLTEAKWKSDIKELEESKTTIQGQLNAILGDNEEAKKLSIARNALQGSGVKAEFMDMMENQLISMLEKDAEEDYVVNKNFKGETMGKSAKDTVGVWATSFPEIFGIPDGGGAVGGDPKGVPLTGNPYSLDDPVAQTAYLDKYGYDAAKKAAAAHNKDINGNPLRKIDPRARYRY